jgi:hypothetical protein
VEIHVAIAPGVALWKRMNARVLFRGYGMRVSTLRQVSSVSHGDGNDVIDLFLQQMDELLLSERFPKSAEGIRALARSERYQEIRRMMLAIAADYDFLAKRAAVVEDMLSNEEPNSVYHTG